MFYIVYDKGSGIITRSVKTNTPPEVWLSEDEAYLEGDGFVADDVYYVVGGEIVERPDMPISVNKQEILADGVDEVVITNIPANTQCFCVGNNVVIDDGEFAFSTDTAGRYMITLTNPPYKDIKVVVNAS
jgi:hypothetical protein